MHGDPLGSRLRRALRRAPPPVPLTAPDGCPPLADDLAVRLLARAGDFDDSLELLRRVFAAGGYETSRALALRLEPALHRQPRRVRKRALRLLTSVWIAAGEPERALALWADAGRDLSAAHPARQALSMLFESQARPVWRSALRIRPYLADAGLRAQTVEADEIRRFLRARPFLSSLRPELELLAHNARGRAHLDASFSTYLRRQELPWFDARPGATPWLAGLHFHAPRLVRSGPLVSVIMSVRNSASTVRYALSSILDQTYRSLEVLVCDDASTDQTFEILVDGYARDPRVRLFRSEVNQGTYNVRNALTKLARGSLITFQDGDDLSLPNRIASQVDSLRSDSVACVANWLRVRQDGGVVFFSDDKASRLSIVSLLARRDCLAAVGPYPSARFGADLDIYKRLLVKHGPGRIVRLQTPLILSLWSEGSLTRTVAMEALESGYRSPGRRRYSELLFRRELFGADALSEEELVRELRAMDNFIEPQRVIPHGAATSVQPGGG